MKRDYWGSMGFVWDSKARGLCWTEKGHLWWLPEFIKNVIIVAVNKTCCAIWGHYWFPHDRFNDYKKRVCVMCCKVEVLDSQERT